jgi:hypothetical protein
MPDNIARRRPVGWNALLHKGHVHQPSKSAQRRDERADVEHAIDQYWDEYGAADGHSDDDLSFASDDLKVRHVRAGRASIFPGDRNAYLITA